MTEPPARSESRGAAWRARVLGRCAASYLRRITPGATLPTATSGSLGTLHEIRLRNPGRKLVVFYWIRDVLPMMLVDWKQRQLGAEQLEDVEFVCDDSYGGRVAEIVLKRLGRRTLFLRWRRPIDRIRDVQRILRSSAPMGIAVDGHGPYGHVGEPFARLVSRSGAVAVPVAAAARPSWVLPLRSRLVLPAPRADVVLAIGEPLVADPERSLSAEQLQRALEAATAIAATAVRREGPTQPEGPA